MGGGARGGMVRLMEVEESQEEAGRMAVCSRSLRGAVYTCKRKETVVSGEVGEGMVIALLPMASSKDLS